VNRWLGILGGLGGGGGGHSGAGLGQGPRLIQFVMGVHVGLDGGVPGGFRCRRIGWRIGKAGGGAPRPLAAAAAAESKRKARSMATEAVLVSNEELWGNPGAIAFKGSPVAARLQPARARVE
jgi:hypothetical protein